MEEVVADVVAVAEKKRRHAPYDRIFFFVGGGGWRAQPTTRLRPRSQENSDRRIRNAPIRGIAIYTSNSLTTVGIYHNNKISKGVS